MNESTQTEIEQKPKPTSKTKKAAPKKKAAKPLTPVPVQNKPSQPTPLEMMDRLIATGASAEQLQILFDLHQQWEKNEARKQYVQAMAMFKQDPPEIQKSKHVYYETKRGDVVDYWHSDLDDIVTAVSEPLAAVGINMDWSTEQGDQGRIKVTCLLTHFLGHTKEVSLQGSPDDSGGKNNIQAVGSTVKYLQRYTAMAALGLSDADMDNDGGDGRKTLAEWENENEGDKKPELPSYPDKLMSRNKPAWQKLVNDGKQPQSIINMVSTKYSLTDAQKEEILSIKPVAG